MAVNEARLTEIIKTIQAYDTIIIHRHEHPDPDAIGSQGGLAEMLKLSFPEKKVYAVGADIGNLGWLNTMDTVADDVYQNALVIVTDTANTPRICDQRFSTGKALIKIDHHPNDDPYGDITYVDVDASSCSEIIVDLFHAGHGLLKLNGAAARLLYAGIVGDTGRFLYPATTSKTFRAVSELVTYDFSPADVSQRMNEINLGQARLQSYVFNHLQVDDHGAAWVIIPQAALKELGISNDDASAAVSTPGRLRNVKAWLEFVENPAGPYRVHLRSKGPVINELAKAHDGGGHPLASGAKAKDQAEIDTMIQQLQTLVAAWHD
ncbi:MAG: bifunctional oligoribonuclease/PAP phosphatase NrnA [Schleiferilactobacillus harbinensis]